MRTVIYFLIGILFGIIMYKSEASSWFRIYEMFQFDSFHMYGIIGSALFCGSIATFLLKKYNTKSILDGEAIVISDKDGGWKRYLYGGLFFGFGWAIAGACPGPMFTLLGAGFFPILVVIVSATFGTFCYGVLKNKLPH